APPRPATGSAPTWSAACPRRSPWPRNATPQPTASVPGTSSTSPGRSTPAPPLARSLYPRAATARPPRPLVTALPHAFYPESSWRDDMELGAAEIALAAQALGDPRAGEWLREASLWAHAYLAREAGNDTLNVYDTSAVARAELVRATRAQGIVGDDPALLR